MSAGSRGFSLVEVIVGAALVVIALACVAQITNQLSRVQVRYSATMRLEATMNDMLTDSRAALRYEGPAAAALLAGLVPGNFKVYQTEPDNAHASVACSAEHLTEQLNVIRFSCRDRSGITLTRDLDLTNTQPYPGSIMTASPATVN